MGSVDWFLRETQLAFEKWRNRLTRSDFFIPQNAGDARTGGSGLVQVREVNHGYTGRRSIS